MWKDKLAEIFSHNKGLLIGGLVGLIIFIVGVKEFLGLAILVLLGMVIGDCIQKNKIDIKESLKSFIDKL